MDGHVALLVKTQLRPEDGFNLAEEITDEVRLAYEDQDDDPVQFSVQRTPKGPAIFLAECVDLDLAIAKLSAALSNRGYDDATLTTVPIVRPYHGHGLTPLPSDEMGSINGYLAFRGTRGMDGRLATWEVAADDAEAALRQLVDWVLALPNAEPVADVCTGLYYTRVSLPDIYPVMQARMRSMTRRTLQTNAAIVYAGHAFREVSVVPTSGKATFCEGSELVREFDWRLALDDARTVLSESGAWCDYGHLTRGHAVFSVGSDHHSLRTPRKATIGPTERIWLEDGRLFDAFGVYRLKKTVAEQLPMTPLWTIEPAREPEFSLASHVDPDAWFAAPDLDDATYGRAQQELKGHLIDSDQVLIHSISAWHRRQQSYARFAEKGLVPQTYWERGR